MASRQCVPFVLRPAATDFGKSLLPCARVVAEMEIVYSTGDAIGDRAQLLSAEGERPDGLSLSPSAPTQMARTRAQAAWARSDLGRMVFQIMLDRMRARKQRFREALKAQTAVRSLAAGHAHSLGLREDGSVACWGMNDDGQAPAEGVEGPFVAVDGGGVH